MNLDGIASVFEVVLDSIGCRGKLARLSNRNEADSELVGQGRAEHEATRLDAYDGVDRFSVERLRHELNAGAEGFDVGEERRDVLEEDALLREVRHVADARAQVAQAIIAHRSSLDPATYAATPRWSGCVASMLSGVTEMNPSSSASVSAP